MAWLLGVLSVVTALAGGGVWSNAQSAMHQMLAANLFVLAGVLFTGAGIVEALRSLPGRIEGARANGVMRAEGAREMAAAEAAEPR